MSSGLQTEPTHVWRQPVRRIFLLSALFILGYICTRIFEFSQPLLNYLFVLLVMSLPFFAIYPIRRLSKLAKIAGYVIVSPLLLIEIFLLLGFVACGSPEVHHYRADSCVQEEQHLEQDGYSVHLLHDCGGGATVDNSQWIEQRKEVVPGLFLVKTVDEFYGAARAEMSFTGENQLFLRRYQGETPEGIEDHVYPLKSHVYF